MGKTFLFTWSNSTRGWPYRDLKKLVQHFEEGDAPIIPWNCKTHKRAHCGDRIFLIKQGKKPRGLFGSGQIVRDPYPDLETTCPKGGHPFHADISFDVLMDPIETNILVSQTELLSLYSSSGLWNSQFSGKEIPADVAQRLEDIWAEKITAPLLQPAQPESIFTDPPKTKPRKRNWVVGGPTGKFNIANQDQNNKILGNAGEQFVLDLERARLQKAGRADLAAKIIWIAHDKGAGEGYDILSFKEDGSEIHIEVKTTAGGKRTPFFITQNEMKFAERNRVTFRLYRVFSYQNVRQVFVLCYPLEDHARVEPAIYKVSY